MATVVVADTLKNQRSNRGLKASKTADNEKKRRNFQSRKAYFTCYILIFSHQLFYQKGGEKMQEYIIRHVMEHVEVYNAAGDFLFSADTEQEAQADIAILEQ